MKYYFFLFGIFPLTVYGQMHTHADPFNQVLTLNPAFAAIHDCTKLSTNYTQTFYDKLYSVSAEQSLIKINSSAAFYMSNLQEGNGILNTQNMQFTYAYRLRQSGMRKTQLAVTPEFENRILNSEKIITGSMLPANKTQPNGNDLSLNTTPERFFDVKFSALYYSKTKQFGISASGFQNFFEKKILFPEIVIHLDKIFTLKRVSEKIMPFVIFEKYNRYENFWLGFRYINSNFFTNFQINFQQKFNSLSPIATVGVKYGKLRFSYTYETGIVQKLSILQHRHSIGVSYMTHCNAKRKSEYTIYCNDF